MLPLYQFRTRITTNIRIRGFICMCTYLERERERVPWREGEIRRRSEEDRHGTGWSNRKTTTMMMRILGDSMVLLSSAMEGSKGAQNELALLGFSFELGLGLQQHTHPVTNPPEIVCVCVCGGILQVRLIAKQGKITGQWCLPGLTTNTWSRVYKSW